MLSALCESIKPERGSLATSAGIKFRRPHQMDQWREGLRSLRAGAVALAMIRLVLRTDAEPKVLSDLNLAHKGTVAVDTAFLNRAPQSEAVQAFFAAARKAFGENPKARFADLAQIRQAAEDQGLTHLGGPMLGVLSPDGLHIWVRTLKPAQVTVRVETPEGERRFGPAVSTAESDLTAIVCVTGLKPGLRYPYRVLVDDMPITMPDHAVLAPACPAPAAAQIKIAFGADFHKSGLWNRPLLDQIRKRGSSAMLLLGDSAVDDRDSDVGLHRADYLLRDLSPAWQELAASVAVYATWDDHDYFNNDKSGIPPGATAADRAAVRSVWQQSWNNPACGFEDQGQGIFFRTRIGPCDLIMLDTRFFRSAERSDDAFLGKDQSRWLVDQLADCTGPFVILTSGTMWSDNISAGKDSWGKWDPAGRERLFDLIEKQRIGGVLLLSGDRHGARVLRIPRPSGFVFYEFELGSLGAHAGPPERGTSPEQQLFGLTGEAAFGEFSFDTAAADPTVTMRVVSDSGQELYQLTLRRSQLMPGVD